MKLKSGWIVVAAGVLLASLLTRLSIAGGQAEAPLSERDYPIKPVPFTQVRLTDQFWAPKIETNRAVSIPTAFDQCERTGRIENFVRAAQVLRGEDLKDKHAPPFPFDDTDPYKVIEGASYTLGVHPDPKLKRYIDNLIETIAAAQEPDGYLYTTRTIDPQHPHPWAGTQRWQNEEVLSHELYNLGHLYEAAVANFQATGERKLLDVAIKSANLLVATFGPGKQKVYSGHQIVEMGLVKLYRVTGNQQYLALAKFFLDSRGPGGRAYNQADVPVVDQTQAEVWTQLWRLFGEFGLPDAILTDNGSCFSGTWSQCPSGLEMQLWRLVRQKTYGATEVLFLSAIRNRQLVRRSRGEGRSIIK